MVSLIIACLLIIAFIFALPFIVRKISDSRRLKKWQKVVLNAAIIGFGCLIAITCLVANEAREVSRWYESGISLTKDPKVAKEFLDGIDISIVLPEFTVRRHTLEFTGGDDTEERWDIDFTKALTESFKASLDSLSHVAPSRWRYDKHVVRRGMSADEEEFYIFSFWNPELIELHEMVMINITMNEGILIHRKI